MPRNTQEQAALLRAYAASAGCSERTARNHRAQRRQAWLDFLQAQGLRAVPSSGAGAKAPPATRPMTPLERAEAAEMEAWRLLQRLQQAAESTTDAVALPAIARGIKDARRAWQEAAAYTAKARVDAQVLIPIARVRELQRELVPPLADALRALKNNIAGRLAPAQRAAYYNAWSQEQGNYERALQMIDGRCEQILAPC